MTGPDHSLLVIMGATCERGTMPLYLRQLTEVGIDYRVEDISDRPNQNGGGNLGYRVSLFRKLARKYSDYGKLIFSDAFDVTFYGSKAEVLKKIPHDYVLHAAEKNCYPDSMLAARIPATIPWRFANGGLAAGTPIAFMEWCDAAERHPCYKPAILDQEFLNLLVADRNPLARIDETTKLFYCLYGGYAELDFAGGLPINVLCCTFPNFLHANGSWPTEEMFAKYERSLQINGPVSA